MNRRRVLGLIALACAARIAYWLATVDYRLTSDAESYYIIARNVAHGHGVADVFPQLERHFTAFRPPGFPLVLGAVFRVLGASVGVGRVTNLVIGVAVVLLVERLVRRTSGARAGLFAAIAVAVYPPLIANDVAILTESLSLLLLLLLLLTVLDGRWQLAGVLMGVLVLTRHSAQLLPLVLLVPMIRWIGWKKAIGAVGLAVLVVVPWVVRNQIRLGGAVLNTANGFNLAASYSEQAHEDQNFVDAAFDKRFDDIRLLQFDEVAWDRELRRRGLDGLRAHPLDVLRVSRRNALAYLELTPSKNDHPEGLDGRNLDVRHWSLPVFYAVTAAGLFGLWRARHNRFAVLVALCAAYFSLVSIVSVAPPRLRAPFDLACCVGVGLLVGQRPSRSSSSSSDLT